MEIQRRPDRYAEVKSLVEGLPEGKVSVPYLGRLLEVDSTTLTAKFRRENIPIQVVGRTGYIPKDLALKLVEGHKYALMGWITVREAGAMKGIKPETIKARCDTDRLEGYVDLTKRLRVNPDDVAKIDLRRGSNTNAKCDLYHDVHKRKALSKKYSDSKVRNDEKTGRKKRLNEYVPPVIATSEAPKEYSAPSKFVLPEVRKPEIRVIRA